LTLLGAALYFWRIGAQGLWYDEAVTALRVTRSLAVIWRADPFIGPLHEVLLHFWVLMAGTSEAGLRSLSALFAVASIPLFYVLARRLIAPRAAMVATVLFAVSPFTIFFAQEARQYALLMLLTIGAMLAFERGVRTRGRGAWVALALLNAALLYTHSYAVFVLLVQAVGLIIFRRNGGRSAVRQWLGSLIVSVALFGPRIPAVIWAASYAGLGRHALPLLKVPFTFLVFSVGYNAVPMNAETRLDYLSAVLDAWPFLAAVLVGFGLALILGWRIGERTPSGRLLLLWCFLPALIVFVLARFIPAIAAERYFVITFPAFVMLIALGIARPTWPARAAGVIIVVVLAAALHRYYLQPERYRWKDDWPTTVKVAGRMGGDRILFLSRSVPAGFLYYAAAEVAGAAVALPPLTKEREIERALAGVQRVVLIESISHEPEFSRPLHWLERHGDRVARPATIPYGDGQRVSLWVIRPGGVRAAGED